MMGVRFLVAGGAAICGGLLITFNEVAGGPLRGIPVILLGAALAYFGLRKLGVFGQTPQQPAPTEIEARL
jgi:hypothetical protein